MNIEFASFKLTENKAPLLRDVQPYMHWTSANDPEPEYLEIRDESGKCVLHLPLSDLEVSDDVRIALDVARISPNGSLDIGGIWTDVVVSLTSRGGHDFASLIFAVKLNVVQSPYDIQRPVTKSSQLLSQLLHKYFPVRPLVSNNDDTWSPQDFYRSVHSPVRNDPVAASMVVHGLQSSLYPFQKRAVQWLLRREGAEWSKNGYVEKLTHLHESDLPPSFSEAADSLGRRCYISHLFGIAALDPGPFKPSRMQIRGGILAEEMGLGKTVEMLSLITLHRRPGNVASQIIDTFTGLNVRPTQATLIIAPPSILPQWISEVHKHAPNLTVMHYEGVKKHRHLDPSDLIDELAKSDIVVTTYDVLTKEIHFTPLNPEKNLRRVKEYPREKSPLLELSWWRTVIDEAQLVENGVSKSAVVAKNIPRINAWCVTGTPIRKGVNDLHGLLLFLRYEPYAAVKLIWKTLISSHKDEFRKLFNEITLRHSKQSVRGELRLPTQRRYIIQMPFTPIEEQLYRGLFEEMCADIRVNAEGAPLTVGWDPDLFEDKMRFWLEKLRRTALHPEVGGRNRQVLGQKKDALLRTIDQVLDAMMEQADVILRTDQRALLAAKIKRGQLFENSPRVNEALAIWEEAAKEAAGFVTECREQLQKELVVAQASRTPDSGRIHDMSELDEESDGDDDEPEATARLGAFRNRLRSALEIYHVATFFRANAYFQIKSNEEMTAPKSPEFEALEKLEMEGYDEAKKLRREILREIYRKADKLMRYMSKKAERQSFVQVPQFPSKVPKGGIESRRIMEQLDDLGLALDEHANTLDEWREHAVQMLLRSLLDEDEGREITGDEYEDSTKIQDEVLVYVQALRVVIADRHDALTGQENQLITSEVKTAIRLASEGQGAFPEKTLELLKMRESIKPRRGIASVRSIVAELRGLATSLRANAQDGNSRAEVELAIVETHLKATQKHLTEQLKSNKELEKEIALFTKAMNTRVEYYRQLQELSDMVEPYEGPNDEATLHGFLQMEEKLQTKITTAKSKRRYLDHLKAEAERPQEGRICVICQEQFETGALTVCGHLYCKECIHLWWRANHSCPVCKRRLVLADMHEVTYKPQQLIVQTEEIHNSPTRPSKSSPFQARNRAIYSEISKSKLAEIKSMELPVDGPSFTTKIDTLVRHLLWVRESDPGAKSIIFSQFRDFLETLAAAFDRYRIGFSSIDKPDGITKFKSDPAVECFLLHAKAHSSGLNLVNANHVFLCEPLLNTALELQAIARVDRIGQNQETNVWMYLVSDTVEESVYQLAVKRRMEHMEKKLLDTQSSSDKSKGKDKAREVDNADLDAIVLDEANSIELQVAPLSFMINKFIRRGFYSGGEMVEKKDLWECLFGGAEKRNFDRALVNQELGRDVEVDRFLRAEAANERAGASGSVAAGGSGSGGLRAETSGFASGSGSGGAGGS